MGEIDISDIYPVNGVGRGNISARAACTRTARILFDKKKDSMRNCSSEPARLETAWAGIAQSEQLWTTKCLLLPVHSQTVPNLNKEAINFKKANPIIANKCSSGQGNKVSTITEASICDTQLKLWCGWGAGPSFAKKYG